MITHQDSRNADQAPVVGLRRQAVRAGAASLAAQGALLIVAVVSQVVLARLLTPSDFGLVAMVMAFMGLASLFRDLGLSTATIQQARLDHDDLTGLFWIAAGLGGCVAIGFAAFGPLLARFYGDGRLVWVTAALAIPCLLGGLATVHQSLLRREMRFVTLGFIDLISLAVATTVAVVAALLGGRHWSLVLASVAGAAVTTAGVWMACGWRPGAFSWRKRPAKAITFGGYVAAFNLTNYLARNLDNALIGWYWGDRLLGFYSKAYSLLMLPLQNVNAPMAAVAIPTLSRLQADPPRFRAAYVRVLSLTAFLTVPLISVLALVPGPFIEVAFGRAWQPSAPIFRFLSLAALPQAVLNTTGWLLIAGGRPDRLFRWSMIATPVIAGSFLAGLPWGPDAVAAAYAAACFLLVVPCLAYTTKSSPVSPRDVAGAVWRQFTAAAIGAAACLLLLETVAKQWPATAQLVSATGVFVACYLGVMLGAFRTAKTYWALWHDLRSNSVVSAEGELH